MTIFSKIVAGDVPSYKIAETENCLAFLDVSPLRKGHTLVIPKEATDKLFDVREETYSEMMRLAYRVGNALEKTMPCVRVGIAVLGLEVPHAHIHLVPINSQADLNFGNKRLELTKEEFIEIANTLQKELNP